MLKALTKHSVTSNSVYECVKNLKEIGHQNVVNVIWVPGHEEYSGNEKADLLAKRGTAKVQDLSKVECGISLQLIRARAKIWLNDVATSDWLKTNTAKYFKEVWRNYSNKKTKLLLQLNRVVLQRIVAFTICHGRFKAHLTKMKILSESKSKYCEKDEMAKHILCDCDGLAALRQRLRGKAIMQKSIFKFCNSALERI